MLLRIFIRTIMSFILVGVFRGKRRFPYEKKLVDESVFTGLCQQAEAPSSFLMVLTFYFGGGRNSSPISIIVSIVSSAPSLLA